jgi:hypothetical protein
MGVTIHFEGKLKSEDDFAALLNRVREVAKAQTWLTEVFESREVTLLRVREDETPWDYKGPQEESSSISMRTATRCVWNLIRDLYIQEYVKTQFAGVRTHIQLVALLRSLQDFFVDLKG